MPLVAVFIFNAIILITGYNIMITEVNNTDCIFRGMICRVASEHFSFCGVIRVCSGQYLPKGDE